MNNKHKRVAAYIRVGGGDTFQDMLDAEKTKFEKSIRKHETWEFAGCYADIGPADGQRPELQRLLEDCREGKIDTIVVKNTGRISKNLAEVIKIAMELMLLEPPVGIYFMEENSFTLSSNEIFCLGGLVAIEAEKLEQQNGKGSGDSPAEGDGDE